MLTQQIGRKDRSIFLNDKTFCLKNNTADGC